MEMIETNTLDQVRIVFLLSGFSDVKEPGKIIGPRCGAPNQTLKAQSCRVETKNLTSTQSSQSHLCHLCHMWTGTIHPCPKACGTRAAASCCALWIRQFPIFRCSASEAKLLSSRSFDSLPLFGANPSSFLRSVTMCFSAIHFVGSVTIVKGFSALLALLRSEQEFLIVLKAASQWVFALSVLKYVKLCGCEFLTER